MMPKSAIAIIIFISSLVILLVTPSVFSFEAESENFRLQMGNFNYAAGEKTSSSYQLRDTGGELAPGQSTSTNYTVKAGFEYVATIIPFTFTISNNSIAFGTLSPQTPKTDTTDLTVTSGAAYGYQVTNQADSQLQNTAYPTVFINDVTGDNEDITHTQEGTWSQNTTYGFGYTLSNTTGTDAVFTSGYRAFADESNSESPAAVMSKNGVTKESEVQLTYKVNISGTQEAGNYQNTITYIATGTF